MFSSGILAKIFKKISRTKQRLRSCFHFVITMLFNKDKKFLHARKLYFVNRNNIFEVEFEFFFF